MSNLSVVELKNRLNEMTSDFDGKCAARTLAEENVKKAEAYNRAFFEHLHTGMPFDALKEGSDGSGGYLVPETYEKKLVKGLEEHNFMREICKTITTEAKLRIPIALSHPAAYWVEEGQPFVESDMTFGRTEIDAHKLATSILVSDELLEDSGIDLEAYILSEFGERMGAAEEEAFLVGDGEGKPLGIIHQAQVGVVTENKGKIDMDEIVDLMYSLRRPYREKAVFVMSEAAYLELRKIKVEDGKFIWSPDLKAGEPDTLFGITVYVSKYLPNLDDGNIPVLYGDFSHYWIGDRGKRTIKRLVERYADHGQVAYIASQRVDGKLVCPEAVKALVMKNE